MLIAPEAGPSRPGSRTPSRFSQTAMAHHHHPHHTGRGLISGVLDSRSAPPPLDTLSRRFRRAIIDDDLSRAKRIYAQAIKLYGPPSDMAMTRYDDDDAALGDDLLEMGTLRDFQVADSSRPSAKSSGSRRGRSSWDEVAFGPHLRNLRPPTTNESGGGGWIGGAPTLSGFFGLASEGGATGCFHIRNVSDPYAVPGPSNWMTHAQAGKGAGPSASASLLTSSASGLRMPYGPREEDIAGKTSLALALECGASEEMCAWLIEQGHERGGFSRDASNTTIVQLAALYNRPAVIEACCIDVVADAALSHHAKSMSTETRRIMRRRGLTVTTDSSSSDREREENRSQLDVGGGVGEEDTSGEAEVDHDVVAAAPTDEEQEDEEDSGEALDVDDDDDDREEGTASQRATPVPRPRQESERTAVADVGRHSVDALRPKIGRATTAALEAHAAERERRRKEHIPRGTKRLHASVLGLRGSEARRAAEEEVAARATNGDADDDDDDPSPSPDAVSHEVRELLDWGDNDGRTALQVAAMKGHEECVKLLLDLGADINIADREGNTPLHYAAMWGQMLVMQHLIERGCSFALKNIEGFTAADYAYTHSVQSALFALGRAHYEGRRAARKRTAMAAANAEPSIAHEPHGTVPFSLWGEVGAPALQIDDEGKLPPTPARGYAHLPAFEEAALSLSKGSTSLGASSGSRSLGFTSGSMFRSPGRKTSPLPPDDPGLTSSSSASASTSGHALTPSVRAPGSATLVDPQLWSTNQTTLSSGSTLLNPSSSSVLYEVNTAAEKVRLKDQAAMSFFRLQKSPAGTPGEAMAPSGAEGTANGAPNTGPLATGRHARIMTKALSTAEEEEQEELLGSHVPGAFYGGEGHGQFRHARSLFAGAAGRE